MINFSIAAETYLNHNMALVWTRSLYKTCSVLAHFIDVVLFKSYNIPFEQTNCVHFTVKKTEVQ